MVLSLGWREVCQGRSDAVCHVQCLFSGSVWLEGPHTALEQAEGPSDGSSHRNTLCPLVADTESAQSALQLLNGYKLQGKPLVIAFGKSRKHLPEADSAIPSSSAAENAPAT